MPYKRENSTHYQIRRRCLPGYGDTGRISSRTSNKRVARDMERALEDVANRALLDATWYPVLDAVCREKTLEPAELLRARTAGTLEALKCSLVDPLLTEAVSAYIEAGERDRETRIGLEQLLAYAPAGSRLSYLRDGRTITDMCHRSERDGRKRNTVRRYLMRSISHLLRYHWGNAQRNRAFSDVAYAAEDDTREVHLTPAEIDRLLIACREHHPELQTLVQLALVTGADRGVLLAGRHTKRSFRGLLSRDVKVYQEEGVFSGEIYLRDSKTEHRTRTLPLTDLLCRELLPMLRGKKPDDNVFTLNYVSFDYVWQKVKRAAGLEHIHFKDLRAQISIYGEEAGVPLTVLSKTMGHGQESMTRRYQQRSASITLEQLEAIESRMLNSSTQLSTQRENTDARLSA